MKGAPTPPWSSVPPSGTLLKRRTVLKGLLGAAGALGLGLPTYARFIEPWWVDRVRRDIPLEGLPAGFDGLRVAQLSDIHFHRRVPLDLVAEAVRIVTEFDPHLVALTGDFLYGDDETLIHPLAEALSDLRAPLGVWAVPGNHDYWIFSLRALPDLSGRERIVFEALERVGVRVLRNESVTLERKGARMDLVGLDDYWSGALHPSRAYRDTDPDRAALVLAHNPDTLAELTGRRADLILSGHTHGGQIRIPLAGPLLVPLHRTAFTKGLYRAGTRTIYVNRGLGFVWYPLRFGARPEIALLTLRSPSS